MKSSLSQIKWKNPQDKQKKIPFQSICFKCILVSLRLIKPTISVPKNCCPNIKCTRVRHEEVNILCSEISNVLRMFLNLKKMPNRRKSVGNGSNTCSVIQNIVFIFLVY